MVSSREMRWKTEGEASRRIDRAVVVIVVVVVVVVDDDDE